MTARNPRPIPPVRLRRKHADPYRLRRQHVADENGRCVIDGAHIGDTAPQYPDPPQVKGRESRG